MFDGFDVDDYDVAETYDNLPSMYDEVENLRKQKKRAYAKIEQRYGKNKVTIGRVTETYVNFEDLQVVIEVERQVEMDTFSGITKVKGYMAGPDAATLLDIAKSLDSGRTVVLSQAGEVIEVHDEHYFC